MTDKSADMISAERSFSEEFLSECATQNLADIFHINSYKLLEHLTEKRSSSFKLQTSIGLTISARGSNQSASLRTSLEVSYGVAVIFTRVQYVML